MDNRLQDVQVERPRAGAAVVVFTGEHDLSTSESVEALLGSLIEENELVVVDFSEAEFVDSSTIYALVKSHRAAERARQHVPPSARHRPNRRQGLRALGHVGAARLRPHPRGGSA